MEEKQAINLSAIINGNQSKSGIWSKTFFKGSNLNAVLMRIGGGEELTEHTSSYPAILQVLDGKGTLIMDGERAELEAGTWVYMPAGTAHELSAEASLTFVLQLIKGGKAKSK